MLYAVSEIMGFMLLATLLGGAAGWWLARTGLVSVAKAMDRSGAHAASDRELESARAEIAQLTAKLAVARDAIRELETEGGGKVAVAAIPAAPVAPVALHAVDDDDADAGPGEGAMAVDAVDEVHVDVDSMTSTEAAAEFASADTDPETDYDAEAGAELGSDEDAPVAATEARPRSAVPLRSKDRGGKRLSTRIAEASVISRNERAVPKIEFGEPAPEDD